MAEPRNDGDGVDERRGWSRRNTLLAVFIALVLTLAVISVIEYNQLETSRKQNLSTQSSSESTTCFVTGQPGPFYLRVVSDSDQTPITGAVVNATSQPINGDCIPATSQEFTTNNTEWYSLGTLNLAGYSFVVTYSGQAYSFTADLRPISVTCATLYIPSGETNVTIKAGQTTCP